MYEDSEKFYNKNKKFVIEDIFGLTEETIERLKLIKKLIVETFSNRFLVIMLKRIEQADYMLRYKNAYFFKHYDFINRNISFPATRITLTISSTYSEIQEKGSINIILNIQYRALDSSREKYSTEQETLYLIGIKEPDCVMSDNIAYYLDFRKVNLGFNEVLWNPNRGK